MICPRSLRAGHLSRAYPVFPFTSRFGIIWLKPRDVVVPPPKRAHEVVEIRFEMFVYFLRSLRTWNRLEDGNCHRQAIADPFESFRISRVTADCISRHAHYETLCWNLISSVIQFLANPGFAVVKVFAVFRSDNDQEYLRLLDRSQD